MADAACGPGFDLRDEVERLRAKLDRIDPAAAKQQRAIWIRRCPALFAQREELREAVLACIGDAEGQEAVSRQKMLTLTKGQVQMLAAALDHARDVFEARDGD